MFHNLNRIISLNKFRFTLNLVIKFTILVLFTICCITSIFNQLFYISLALFIAFFIITLLDLQFFCRLSLNLANLFNDLKCLLSHCFSFKFLIFFIFLSLNFFIIFAFTDWLILLILLIFLFLIFYFGNVFILFLFDKCLSLNY